MVARGPGQARRSLTAGRYPLPDGESRHDQVRRVGSLEGPHWAAQALITDSTGGGPT